MPTRTCWNPFTLSIVGRAAQRSGVYEIALDGQRHPYVYGWSSTLYYGMSRSGLRGRLSDHIEGRGNATVYGLLLRRVGLKVRWATTAGDPRPVECGLLDRFERKFGERPLGNIQGCAV